MKPDGGLQQPGWETVAQDEHLEFYRAMRDLARGAKDAGHRHYRYLTL